MLSKHTGIQVTSSYYSVRLGLRPYEISVSSYNAVNGQSKPAAPYFFPLPQEAQHKVRVSFAFEEQTCDIKDCDLFNFLLSTSFKHRGVYVPTVTFHRFLYLAAKGCTMPTLELHNGYPLWEYIPNRPAAIIFTMLFSTVTIYHAFLMFRHRLWFCIPFIIGGICKLSGFSTGNSDH